MGHCTTKVINAAERSERPRTVIQGSHRERVTITECIGSSDYHIPPLNYLEWEGATGYLVSKTKFPKRMANSNKSPLMQ